MKFILKISLLLMLLMLFEAAEAKEHVIESVDDNPTWVALQAWEKDFYWHLLQHEDPNLQAHGLFSLTSFGGPFAVSQLSEQDSARYQKVFNVLMKHGALSYQSIFLLLTICQNGKDVAGCDYYKLAEDLIQKHGDNMASYLFSLSMANRNEVEGEMIALVRAMAQAEFFNDFLYVSETYQAALRAYTKEHAIPDLGYELEERFLTSDLSSKAERMLIKEKISAYRLFMYINTINLKMPIPTYKPLVDVCKKYQELNGDCMSISKVLIESEHWIPELIGHRIKINLFEASGDVKAYEQAVEHKAQLKVSTDCLVKISSMPELHQLNLNHANQRMRITRDQGERAGMYHYAKLKYEEAIAQDVDADKQNPDVCVGKNLP